MRYCRPPVAPEAPRDVVPDRKRLFGAVQLPERRPHIQERQRDLVAVVRRFASLETAHKFLPGNQRFLYTAALGQGVAFLEQLPGRCRTRARGGIATRPFGESGWRMR